MHWIKCKDKPPEDNQRVLIKLNPKQEVNPFWYTYYTCTWSAFWDKSTQKTKYFFIEDGIGGSRFDKDIVLGWMPIEELDNIEVE